MHNGRSGKHETKQRLSPMKHKRRSVTQPKIRPIRPREIRTTNATTQGSPVSSNAWLHAMACLVVGSFIAGCDGAKLCRPCEKQPETVETVPETVETVKVEVDWQELAAALKEMQPAGEGGTTVRTDSINVTISADQPSGNGTTTIANWDEVVTALSSLPGVVVPNGCADCEAAEGTPEITHATFAFRFAPPWFNSDQRSLFTSYIVFPEEAKLDEWLDDGEGCLRKDERVRSSVCPDTTFYERTMGAFLEGLSQCATEDKKVKLYTVGFASSTGLNDIKENGRKATNLKDRYNEQIDGWTKDCLGGEAEPRDSTERFNLLIANERADNAAAMLQKLAQEKEKEEKKEIGDFFSIKAKYWCSYADMEAERERSWKDGGDTVMGLVNRRAEVHIEACPAAWTSVRTVGRTD